MTVGFWLRRPARSGPSSWPLCPHLHRRVGPCLRVDRGDAGRCPGARLGGRFPGRHVRRGVIALRRGALAEAEADTRAALEALIKHNLTLAAPLSAAAVGLTLLERGKLDEAAAVVESVPLPLPTGSHLLGLPCWRRGVGCAWPAGNARRPSRIYVTAANSPTGSDYTIPTTWRGAQRWRSRWHPTSGGSMGLGAG